MVVTQQMNLASNLALFLPNKGKQRVFLNTKLVLMTYNHLFLRLKSCLGNVVTLTLWIRAMSLLLFYTIQSRLRPHSSANPLDTSCLSKRGLTIKKYFPKTPFTQIVYSMLQSKKTLCK